jgi:cleavage and polyadenylation specificity factor subunit 3
MEVVDVKQSGEHEITLEWTSSATSDMIADSVLSIVMGIDKSPASVKCRRQQRAVIIQCIL